MNDRNQEVGLIAVIIGAILFLIVLVLLAAGIISWMLVRNANEDLIKADRAAEEARQAQIQAIENEAANPPEIMEEREVEESVPD